MRDPGIGRVLPASLHQGISDVLPARLGFYENWLNAEGLREGTIGLGSVKAVLSFLRQEEDRYEATTERAGTYAAEWTVETMSALERTCIAAAPPWLRARLLLRVARRLVADCCPSSTAAARVRRGVVHVRLRGSVFCAVREHAAHPLCGFYAAIYTRLFEMFGLDARARVVACCATGELLCALMLPLGAGRLLETEAHAS
jgi:hypothetical protein